MIKIGGSWIFALKFGTNVISGYNLSFDQICAINSYRAEVYASLAATLFLYFYSKYYFVSINNRIHALCDNQAYVDKLTYLLKDDYHHHGLYKNTEVEALSLNLHILLQNFSIEHIKGHQDNTKRYHELDIKA